MRALQGDQSDVAAFYDATSGRLVGLLAAMCGDIAEAEDIAQEAYVRLLGRWSAVGRYDDPESWLRTVAIRLMISRMRRAGVARRHLPFLVRRDHVPEPSTDGVTVADALRTLPADQRAVVVLHHVADLPVEEIAATLDVPLGTVKSRLSRGRAALRSLLGTEVSDHA